MKVRIKKSPKTSYKGGGGVLMNPQSLNGREFPYYFPGNEWVPQETDVRTTLPPVDEDQANVEAEKGEEVYVPDTGNDIPAKFTVGGDRHSDGGTPLSVPPDSFFFSDTRDMKIGGPILSYFGKPEDTKKKYTPADLSKQYDLNKFLKQSADPNSTDLQRKTAKSMIDNYNKKLGALALVQESMKGFPNGIPQMANDYLQSIQADQSEGQGNQEAQFGGEIPQKVIGSFVKQGGYAWANSPTGGGFWQDGGSYMQPGGILKQPDTDRHHNLPSGAVINSVHPGEAWWENKTVGPGSPAETGSNKFWHPFEANEGFLDWAGNALEYGPKRMNQALRGYYEWPSETMDRFKPDHPVLGFINDFVQDPINAVPIADAAKLMAKGTVATGKVLAKLPGIKRAVQYMAAQPWEFYGDFVKAYGIGAAKDITKALTKKGVGYIPSVLSQIHRHSQQVQSDQSQFPQMPPGGVVPPGQTALPPPVQPQVPVTNRPDTIFNFQYGGNLPKAQLGNNPSKTGWFKEGSNYVLYNQGQVIKSQTTNPKVTSTTKPAGKPAPQGYDPGYSPQWFSDLNTTGRLDKSMLPSMDLLNQDVPKLQHKGKGISYGTREWFSDPKHLEDFKRRNKWFFKDNKDWDPSKPGAFKQFEEQATKHDTDLGISPYFRSTAAHDPWAADEKGGVHHYLYSGDAIKSKEAVPQTGYEAPPIGTVPLKGYRSNTDAPWWLQDVVGTGKAAFDYLNLRKHLPWGAKVNPQFPEPTFFDPTRALANNTEQMNIGTQGAGVYGNPQSYGSTFSKIQGEGAKNAANIIGEYDNRNVGVANQFAGERAGALNQAEMYNANLATSLYDKNTIANQQFENSQREAGDNLADYYTNAVTNRADAQRYNDLYPHYNIDIPTGGIGHFTGNPFPLMTPGSGTDPVEAFVKKRVSEGMKPEDAWHIGVQYYNPADQYSDERERLLRQGQYPLRSGSRRGYGSNYGYGQ